MGKKLLFMAILLIRKLGAATTAVRGELVCDVLRAECMVKCWQGTGKCMRCCQALGYVHGRCNLVRGDVCYCCNDDGAPPSSPAQERHGRLP
uniref:Uncharacterized protein n=1 Tax=Triticum urartu TaxID=4572 RepID=A0A8R7JW39_TRIUA